jgi:tetratricopeptide (TPR) repeat protein
VQGASVLRGRLDPQLLADLVGLDELAAVRQCEALALAGLLQRVGAHYEFANDLAQECVRASLAPALAAAFHRRAADLLSDQPESMATHAFAAGEHGRAAQGWLLAGQAAMARSAVEDATSLYDHALSAADDPALRARVLLARAVAHEASTAYDAGLRDIQDALVLAREASDRRLEMGALRALGGDIPVALHVSMADVGAHLEAGLHLASGLGDRRAEADFTTRLIVLESSRLRLSSALERAEASLTHARGSASEEAVPLALDGLKTVLGYLGDTVRLPEVLAELVPPLREQRSMWLLQWAVFESSFEAAGNGRWDEARDIVTEALELNQRSGFIAYRGYFRAHLGWFERLAGRPDAALGHGRAAVAETSPVDHPWWYATAAGLLAATTLDLGDRDEAADLARRGLVAAGTDAPEAWRLRCLAPLAAALDDPTGDEAYEEARGLLDAVACPPGRAWIVGADCYLLVAEAARRRDETDRAERVLAPLRVAVAEHWEAVRSRVDAELAQISSATSRAARVAPSVGTST